MRRKLSVESFTLKSAARQRELVALRRRIHRNPELGFREVQTTRLVAQELRKSGLKPTLFKGGTGLMSTINGKFVGKTIALRADIDALPIHEANTHSFVSNRKGVMHGCGHDAHTAALVGAARILAAYNKKFGLHGNVRLIFQPNEEQYKNPRSGAVFAVREGAMRGVDAIVAGHVFAERPLGTISSRAGTLFSSSSTLAVKISIPPGHPAFAKMNSLVVQGTIIKLLNDALAKDQKVFFYPFDAEQRPKVRSSAPEQINLRMRIGYSGSIQGQRDLMRKVIRQLRKIVRNNVLGIESWKDKSAVAKTMASRFKGISIRAELKRGSPPTTPNRALVGLVKEVAEKSGHRYVTEKALSASEDAAFYHHLTPGKVPLAYFMIGAKKEGAETHHSPYFDIDERAIAYHAQMFAATAINYLNQQA